MNITDDMWEAYRLIHPDHEGLDLEDVAKEMGVDEIQVMRMLCRMRTNYPDLFTDISSGGHHFDNGVSRYNGRLDNAVKKLF